MAKAVTKQRPLTRVFWRLSLYAPRRLGYWLNHQATKRWIGCPECGSTRCPAWTKDVRCEWQLPDVSGRE